MSIFGRSHKRERIYPAELRDRMAQEDPDFARVREVQHEALQAITAKRLQDGLSIRRERQFWERAGQ